MIGLSGPARDNLDLWLSEETALAMISQMLGTKKEVMNEAALDRAAELANIMVGSAKARFRIESQESTIKLGLPIVVPGS